MNFCRREALRFWQAPFSVWQRCRKPGERLIKDSSYVSAILCLVHGVYQAMHVRARLFEIDTYTALLTN